MKRLCNDLERMNELVFEYYEGSYRHFLKICGGGRLRNAVIDSSCGGNYLRRSIWKKTPTWQFAPVNLNVQVLLSKLTPYSELREHSELLRVGLDNTISGEPSLTHYRTTIDNEIDYFPSITHGAFAAHALGFSDGGLRKMFSKIEPECVKLKWMQTLQYCGGVKFSAIEPLIKENIANADILLGFGGHQDDPSELFSRAFHLALRIDMCLSQALSHAVCSIRLLLMLASLNIPSYQERLKCALVAGFLIPIQSLLSSQGHEMGMIEDLDGILPLLNSVSFRFVKALGQSVPPAPHLSHGNSAGSTSHSESSRSTSTNTGVSPLVSGPEVTMHRDVDGKLVVDISVTSEEEAMIRSCSAAAAGYVAWSTSSSFRIQRACKQKSPPKCIHKAGQPAPDVIACISVFAVLFTQGVNEMQTLANMAGDSHKQSEINVDSLKKMQKYVMNYVDVLEYYDSFGNEDIGEKFTGLSSAQKPDARLESFPEPQGDDNLMHDEIDMSTGSDILRYVKFAY